MSKQSRLDRVSPKYIEQVMATRPAAAIRNKTALEEFAEHERRRAESGRRHSGSMGNIVPADPTPAPTTYARREALLAKHHSRVRPKPPAVNHGPIARKTVR